MDNSIIPILQIRKLEFKGTISQRNIDFLSFGIHLSLGNWILILIGFSKNIIFFTLEAEQ